jgi:hypothetical protein
MQINGSDKCPVCKNNFQSADRIGQADAYRISCRRCGEYEISSTVLVTLGEENLYLLPYLSVYTRQAWELEGRSIRLNSAWPSLAESHQHTSVHQKADKLLRAIERRTAQPGDYITVDPAWDFPLIDSVNPGPVSYFLNYWEQLGYLDIPSGNRNRTAITVKGWDWLDRGSAGAGIPGRVFVAMSFDPSLEEAYAHGIRKAIEDDCKMTAIRVDKVGPDEKEDFGQKICDRILAEIRRCQFAVVDFTDHNRGAYFEAGFALGLGRAVIWTCSEDQIRHAHFDTRQYPHIVWKDPTDLRLQLAERIQAQIGA